MVRTLFQTAGRDGDVANVAAASEGCGVQWWRAKWKVGRFPTSSRSLCWLIDSKTKLI